MKTKERTINLLIAIGSLLFLTAILEIIFRFPAIQQQTGGNWPKLKTWMDYVWYNERNSWGFRDREHAYQKPKDTYRILILGDSIAYGQMVEFQDIFPVRLEQKLNETSGQTVEVINMGLMGWNTVEQLQALIVYGLRFQPDLVVIAFYLNDPQVKDNPRFEEIADSERKLLPLTGLDQWLNEKSYFYSFVRWRYNRLLEKLGSKTDYRVWQKSLYNQESRGWQDFEFALNQIVDSSRQAGAEIILVNLNLEDDWEEESVQVKSLADSLNLPSLTMRQYFSKLNYSGLVVSPSDWHPNAQAHQIYARILTDYIADKVLNIH